MFHPSTKLFFIVSLVLCQLRPILSEAIQADSSRGSWGTDVRTSYGYLIAHREALMPLQEQHLYSAELSLFKTTNGRSSWESNFLYPEQGIHLALINPGSPDKLGTAVALYPYLDFPLLHDPNSALWFRYGMGIGYIKHIFDPVENYKNTAIGSHLNGVIHFDVQYRKTFNASTSGEIGIGLTHFSNGSMKMPNLGINLPALNIGLRHYFGKKSTLAKDTSAVSCKQGSITAYGAIGFKEIYPALGEKYQTGTLNGLYLFTNARKSDFGIGMDLFYDNSLAIKEGRETGDASTAANFRPGIYGAYQLRVAAIGLLFNLGFYPYTRYKGDGNFYHRIGLRYYFDRYFACVNLKTHYARADFIEWGIGLNLGKNKKSSSGNE